jgi:flagellar hook-associated protein FlgK
VKKKVQDHLLGFSILEKNKALVDKVDNQTDQLQKQQNELIKDLSDQVEELNKREKSLLDKIKDFFK